MGEKKFVKPTLKQLDQVRELFKTDLSHVEDLEVSPTKNGLEVSKMYDYVPMNFYILSGLSEIFGTKNIDVCGKHNYPGCETCDYGSSYTVEFEIWE